MFERLKSLCLLFVIYSQCDGLSNFGLDLKWGHAMNCTYITTFTNVVLEDCYRECLLRTGCLSFDYNVRRKQCGLCSLDTSTTAITRRPAFVYSEKNSWAQSRQLTNCTCETNEVCEIHGSVATCRIKECPANPLANAGFIQSGNIQQAGSTMTFTCPHTARGPAVAKSTCDQSGTWITDTLLCSSYIGCFTDDEERNLEIGPLDDDSLTNDLCLQMCLDHYPTAHMFYYGSQYRFQCFCGQRYPIHPKQPDSNCKTRCAGDGNQICGGTWLISVYQFFRSVEETV